jgi:hypothetical protein
LSTLLQTREKTHGSYHSTAKLSQALKDTMKSGTNWISLSDEQAEALEMIALKIARILSGNPDFADHWDDVIGYAKLARPETEAQGVSKLADLINEARN